MKYTDKQRLQKIYDNASKLNQYIKDKQIKKKDLLSDYSLQWLVTDSASYSKRVDRSDR